MAATDPAARRNKLDGKKETLAQRALTVLFGDNPAGAERLAFGVLFFIPECLPDLADLSDAELREALQTTILRMLRVLSRSPRPGGLVHLDADEARDAVQIGVAGEQCRLMPPGDRGDHAVDEAPGGDA